MSLSKVVETALGELGQHENPSGSNKVKYWTEWWPELQGEPWCVGFQGWTFSKAGERMAFYNGGKTASCRTLLRCYREQGQTVPNSEIQVGDILILNFSGKKENGELDTEHCGLVVEKGKLAGTWYTVEGNTTPGVEGTPQEEYNGGCVAKKLRSVKNVVGVCRPKYKEEEVPKDDVSGHWAKQTIQWAKENDIMEGYPDGSFRPNDPVLRGEEATINYRLYELFTKELVELRKEIARLREEIRQIRGEDDLK